MRVELERTCVETLAESFGDCYKAGKLPPSVWKVVVTPLGSQASALEAEVQADNWLSALRAGRREFGEEGGVPHGASCTMSSAGQVTILDAATRRRYVVEPGGPASEQAKPPNSADTAPPSRTPVPVRAPRDPRAPLASGTVAQDSAPAPEPVAADAMPPAEQPALAATSPALPTTPATQPPARSSATGLPPVGGEALRAAAERAQQASRARSLRPLESARAPAGTPSLAGPAVEAPGIAEPAASEVGRAAPAEESAEPFASLAAAAPAIAPAAPPSANDRDDEVWPDPSQLGVQLPAEPNDEAGDEEWPNPAQLVARVTAKADPDESEDEEWPSPASLSSIPPTPARSNPSTHHDAGVAADKRSARERQTLAYSQGRAEALRREFEISRSLAGLPPLDVPGDAPPIAGPGLRAVSGDARAPSTPGGLTSASTVTATPDAPATRSSSSSPDAHAPSEPPPARVTMPRAPHPQGLVQLSARDVDPSVESPLTYRERSYIVARSADHARLEALLQAEFIVIRRELIGRPRGQLIHLAAFDHSFEDKPLRPPLATLEWKDWRGTAVFSVTPEATEAEAASGDSSRPGRDRRSGVAPAPESTWPVPARSWPGQARQRTGSQPAASLPGAGAAAPRTAAARPVTGPGARSTWPVPRSNAPAPSVPSPATAKGARGSSPPPAAPTAAPPASAWPAAEAPRANAPVVPDVTGLPATVGSSSAWPPSAAAPAASVWPSAPRSTQLPTQPVPAAHAATKDTWPVPAAGELADSPSPDRLTEVASSEQGTREPTGEVDHRLASAFEAMPDLYFLPTPLAGLEFTLELITRFVPSEAISACLYDINTDEFRFVALSGPGAAARRASAVSSSAGLFGAARRATSEALVVANGAADARYDAVVDGRGDLEVRCLAYLPMRVGGHLLGMLQVVNRKGERGFTAADVAVLAYITTQVSEFLVSRRSMRG